VQVEQNTKMTVAPRSGRRIKLGEQLTVVYGVSSGGYRGTKCVENAEQTEGVELL